MKSDLLLLFLFFLATSVAGQRYNLEQDHFTTKDGLSHNAVYNVFQDSRGLYWLTTRYGVNRFDGSEFRIYTKETDGLHTNFMGRAYEDPDGFLWFLSGVDGFLNYSKHENFGYTLFDPYREVTIDPATVLSEELRNGLKGCDMYLPVYDGSILFMSDAGYFIHYRGRGDFSRHEVDLGVSIVDRLVEAPGGNYLIYSYGQGEEEICTVIDAAGRVLSQGDCHQLEMPGFSIVEPAPQRSDSLYWKSYVRQSDNQTGFYGILQADGSWNIVSLHAQFPSIPPTTPLQLKFWDPGTNRFWVQTRNETLLLESGRGIVGRFPDMNLSRNVIKDRDGNLLAASRSDGLRRYVLQANHFTAHGKAGHSHRGIAIDDREIMYVGLDVVGYLTDTIPTSDSDLVLTHSNVVLRDGKGFIWQLQPEHLLPISELGKNFLSRLDRSGNVARTYTADAPIIDQTWALWQDPLDGSIWSGGLKGAVHRTDPASGNIARLIARDNPQWKNIFYVYSFTRVKDLVWIATSSGMFSLNSAYELDGPYSSAGEGNYFLPTSSVHHAHVDSAGQFWLSTGDAGLIRWTPDGSLPMRQITLADGLPSMVLHAAYEDRYGFLWISTEDGIVQLSKKTLNCRTFRQEQGTVDNEFNRISHYRHVDGRIYFGGLTGITGFDPSDFADDGSVTAGDNYLEIVDVLQINERTGQRVNSIAELYRSGTVFLPTTTPNADIRLLPNGINHKDVIVTSQILGWQEEPVQVKNSRVLLEIVPYGTHTLVLRATDINGKILQEKRFIINKVRPFYLRWWFVLAGILLVAAIAYGISNLETRRLRSMVKERTATIQQQADELRQLDTLKSHFFANVSHELRTPLTLLLAPITRLLRQGELSDKNFNSLRRAYESGRRLLGMTTDILDLAKLEDGKMEVYNEPTPLIPLLGQLIGEFVYLSENDGITISQSLNFERDELLEIDRAKVETIIRNLVSNALKYTQRGGSVRITADYRAEVLTVSVSDTGVGIDPRDLPRLFDRFYQARHGVARVSGGTGIGLSICNNLAERMGGRLTVESEPQRGSTFTLHLPAQRVADGEGFRALAQVRGFTKRAVPVVRPDSSGDKSSILIVEDNHDLREYLREILSDTYEVRTAIHGRDALELLAEDRRKNQLPQLIITDLMMPEMDGMQLLHRLKEEPELSLLPTIVLSARAMAGDRLTALRTGIDDYILKPFDEHELRQRIANLLANAHQRITTKRALATPTALPNEAPPVTEEDEWIAQVTELINQHLTDPDFGNQQLADLLFVSVRTLSRRTKQATGLSANKFMLEIRLCRARDLLEGHPRPTLAAVAELVGIQKPSYLSAKFRDRFGVLPSEYGL